MANKRTYGDRCGVARALDVVGERWALLVVRELLLGPKRFTDLRAGLPGLSPDVLSQRLRELEQAGLVRRRKLAPPAGSRVYELTERGLALEPILLELGRWGSHAPVPEDDAAFGADSFVIALRTLFDPEAAAGLDVTVELRLGEDRFRWRVAEGRFEVARGAADRPTRWSRRLPARSRRCSGTTARSPRRCGPATSRSRAARPRSSASSASSPPRPRTRARARPSASSESSQSRRRAARSSACAWAAATAWRS